jgi:D-sedoheptulose 7-phosphate isomerase
MSARAYLAGLGDLFAQIESTDRHCRSLSIDEAIDTAVGFIADLKASPRKAMLVGNGGSAAIVSHIHNDLSKAVGVRAMVYHESPFLTAMANDHGYETVFREPVAMWAEVGDLLIAVSSSGESASIVGPVMVARDKGCRVLTFSGFNPANRLRQLGDVNFYVPSSSCGYVEMTHAILGHCVTDFAVARVAESVERTVEMAVERTAGKPIARSAAGS